MKKTFAKFNKSKGVYEFPFFTRFRKMPEEVWFRFLTDNQYYKKAGSKIMKLSVCYRTDRPRITYWGCKRDLDRNVKLFFSKKPEWEKKYSWRAKLFVFDKKTGECLTIFNPYELTPQEIKDLLSELDAI